MPRPRLATPLALVLLALPLAARGSPLQETPLSELDRGAGAQSAPLAPEFPEAPDGADGAGPRRGGASPWELLDKVEMIVNEEIITHRTLFGELYWAQAQGKISTVEEQQELLDEILRERVDRLLMVQAGQDMGIDPLQIQLSLKSYEERTIERFGGAVGFSQALQENRQDRREWEEASRKTLYAAFWEDLTLGKEPGPEGRYMADRFVRPGQVVYQHRLRRDDPEFLEAIGGTPETVVVRDFVIDAEGHGGLEASKAFLEGIRERILAGEDMGLLVEEYADVKEGQGLLPPTPLRHFEGLDPALDAFLSGAQDGELSGVLPARSETRRGWRLVRLEERREPAVPAPGEREVQEATVELVQKSLDRYRRAVALDRLYSGAYVWPVYLRSREAPAQGPQEAELGEPGTAGG